MAGRQGIEAGRAFVRFGADLSDFEKGLRSARAKLQRFGAGVTAIGAGISAVSAASLAPFVAGLRTLTTATDQIDKASQRAGVTAGEFQRLAFALEQTGASGETAERAFRGLSRFVEQLERGSSSAADVLGRLNLDQDDLVAQGTIGALGTILDRIREISDDPLVRGGLLQSIFGRAGTELLPLLNAGPGGLASLVRQFDDLSLGQSDAVVAAGRDFADASNILRTALRDLLATVGGTIAPTISSVAEPIAKLAGAVKTFTSANPELVRTVALVGGVGLGLGAIGVALGGASIAAGAFLLTLPPVVAAVSAIAPAALAAGAAIAGIGAVLVAVEAATGKVSAGFGRILQSAEIAGRGIATAFDGVLDALVGGNFVAIGQMIGLGLAAGIARAFQQVGAAGLLEAFGLDAETIATVSEAGVAAIRESVRGERDGILAELEALRGSIGGAARARGVTVGTFNDDPRFGAIGGDMSRPLRDVAREVRGIREDTAKIREQTGSFGSPGGGSFR